MSIEISAHFWTRKHALIQARDGGIFGTLSYNTSQARTRLLLEGVGGCSTVETPSPKLSIRYPEPLGGARPRSPKPLTTITMPPSHQRFQTLQSHYIAKHNDPVAKRGAGAFPSKQASTPSHQPASSVPRRPNHPALCLFLCPPHATRNAFTCQRLHGRENDRHDDKIGALAVAPGRAAALNGQNRPPRRGKSHATLESRPRWYPSGRGRTRRRASLTEHRGHIRQILVLGAERRRWTWQIHLYFERHCPVGPRPQACVEGSPRVFCCALSNT